MARIKINISLSPKTVIFAAANIGVANIYRNGKLYAEKPFLSSQFQFNFPFKGKYLIVSDTDIKIKEVKPIEKIQHNIVLPLPDRDKVFKVNKIVFDDSKPSPARIFTDVGIICVNRKFLSYPVEVRLFILLHEIGHFYYTEEYKCDTYAAYHFLEWGCNPSQAFESLAGVLHDNATNDKRIDNIFNLLKK